VIFINPDFMGYLLLLPVTIVSRVL